jgi:bacillithiol system protein YtxJ
MKWIELNSLEQLKTLQDESAQRPVLIFKHSRRCNISRTSLDRLERNWKENEMGNIKPYFLDLLSYREISNNIAEAFQVEHESPQILLIQKGKPVLHLSHFDIEYEQIKSALKN